MNLLANEFVGLLHDTLFGTLNFYTLSDDAKKQKPYIVDHRGLLCVSTSHHADKHKLRHA